MKSKILLFISLLSISSGIFSQNYFSYLNISKNDLRENLIINNQDIKNKIISNHTEFLKLVLDIFNDHPEQLKLVDKNNRLTQNDVPDNLVNLSDYDLHTRYKTMLFVENAIPDFVKMSNDAKNEGIDIFIASTYRDYQFQKQIFTNMKEYYGEEEAAKTVAYPGASQHQTGTAVDFGSITQEYAETEAGIWLKNNAWRYGFSLSYPLNMEDLTTYIWEPWHYRYIGKSAVIIQREFFNNLQQLFLEFWENNSNYFEENLIKN